MRPIFNYIDRPSPVHRLTGATKLVCLVLYSVGAMITFDTRLVACLAVLSFALLKLSKIRLSDVSFLLKLTIFFMLFNNVVLFFFSPQLFYNITLFGRSIHYYLVATLLASLPKSPEASVGLGCKGTT